MGFDSQSSLSGYDSFQVTLGDELRGERATKGKSLLDVQRELRIKAAYVAAIENCDVAVFPNRGFVAGYVRSYGRYLGLDPEDVFERFCAESGFEGVNSDLSGTKAKGRDKSVPVKVDLKNDPLMKSRVGLSSSGGSFDFRATGAALASLLVMAGLLGGVGYGGYLVLQEVQRVELAPVAQAPELADEVAAVSAAPTESAEVGLLDVAAAEERSAALLRLYQPSQPATPLLAPRDGPISIIDPDRVGSFAVTSDTVRDAALAETSTDAVTVAALEEELEAVAPEPAGPPSVSIIAAQPAWVRVRQGDGAVLFEKILAAGERYELPADVIGPELRAGNSGSVFLMVGQTVHGPLGTGPNVARSVSLLADDISASWPIADLTDDQRDALEGELILMGAQTALTTE
ncbi:hypothetical protein POI8812_01710 [Pontivivens insulae]|uniref:Cytoskeleton protein RodZ-like C-terminal domain-containing protein n=1 Tax=Pontivivens insulae TaxID=1639689 RepID=A0A2R8AAZ3_9RHOB|nr:cytoskeletal protein RodZ [Pontivivens insulae]SPF29402.1 hypothetical protein POI8812_01710 [Pontivivens insulae]